MGREARQHSGQEWPPPQLLGFRQRGPAVGHRRVDSPLLSLRQRHSFALQNVQVPPVAGHPGAASADISAFPGPNGQAQVTPTDGVRSTAVSLSELFAGATLKDAIEDVHQFNARGLSCSLSYLPIASTTEEEVEEHVQEYLRALSAIQQQRLDADVTIKLHQLGIYAEEFLAEPAVLRIIEAARASGTFVWIDMEQPDTVDRTLEIYRRASRLYGNVGICLQAYLTRTLSDLAGVLADGGVVRLVKGFYRSHDISNWRAVTRNYRMLMFRVLRESPRPAIATHDEQLIEEAKRFIVDHQVRSAEFQFFQGVRNRLAGELQAQGFAARIYVPYGRMLRYWADGVQTFDLRRQLQRVAGWAPYP